MDADSSGVKPSAGFQRPFRAMKARRSTSATMPTSGLTASSSDTIMAFFRIPQWVIAIRVVLLEYQQLV